MARKARFYLMFLLIASILMAALPSILLSRSAWKKASNEDGTINIILAFAGDIMVHHELIESAYKPVADSYDFASCFMEVKPLIQQADLAFCNLEVVLAGEENGYTGYPVFNALENLATALKESGFDVVSTVNNHSLGLGEEGVYRTLDKLEEAALQTFGTYRNREERDMPLVLDVKGVKIAFTGYTYGINGMSLPEGKEHLVNLLQKELVISDLKKAVEQADLVILYLHWGNKHHRYPSREQASMAEEFLDAGADIIIGSHPHILQPVEFIKKGEAGPAGSEKLVAYSLGNFLGNQRLHLTDTGMILYVRLAFDSLTGSSELVDVSYVPTWVQRYRNHTGMNFRVLPVPGAIEDYRSGRDPLLDPFTYNVLHEILDQCYTHLQFLPLHSFN